jgi:hypothetical protein
MCAKTERVAGLNVPVAAFGKGREMEFCFLCPKPDSTFHPKIHQKTVAIHSMNLWVRGEIF